MVQELVLCSMTQPLVLLRSRSRFRLKKGEL